MAASDITATASDCGSSSYGACGGSFGSYDDYEPHSAAYGMNAFTPSRPPYGIAPTPYDELYGGADGYADPLFDPMRPSPVQVGSPCVRSHTRGQHSRSHPGRIIEGRHAPVPVGVYGAGVCSPPLVSPPQLQQRSAPVSAEAQATALSAAAALLRGSSRGSGCTIASAQLGGAAADPFPNGHRAVSPPKQARCDNAGASAGTPTSPGVEEYEAALAKYHADMREYEEKLLPAYLESEARRRRTCPPSPHAGRRRSPRPPSNPLLRHEDRHEDGLSRAAAAHGRTAEARRRERRPRAGTGDRHDRPPPPRRPREDRGGSGGHAPGRRTSPDNLEA